MDPVTREAIAMAHLGARPAVTATDQETQVMTATVRQDELEAHPAASAVTIPQIRMALETKIAQTLMAPETLAPILMDQVPRIAQTLMAQETLALIPMDQVLRIALILTDQETKIARTHMAQETPTLILMDQGTKTARTHMAQELPAPILMDQGTLALIAMARTTTHRPRTILLQAS